MQRRQGVKDLGKSISCRELHQVHWSWSEKELGVAGCSVTMVR